MLKQIPVIQHSLKKKSTEKLLNGNIRLHLKAEILSGVTLIVSQ